jgi:hypothetical protein
MYYWESLTLTTTLIAALRPTLRTGPGFYQYQSGAVCPYGTSTMPLTTALHMDTTGQSGSPEAPSLGPARGFAALTTSTAMLT